jgi:hypothetical protein
MTKDEKVKEMALRGAGYLIAMEGKGKSSFDLSFAMEIFTGVDKEECLDKLLAAQAELLAVVDQPYKALGK